MSHVVNPELIKLARVRLIKNGFIKRGFMDAAAMGGAGGGGGAPPMDPSMMGGGGGGGAPPMDPSMMGGAPPMDPSMMGGGGGGEPPPPSGGGGDSGAVLAKLDQLMQIMQGGAAGGAQSGANAAGQMKPKIDVNVEIMQIKHMLAKIIDSMGIPVSAQEMTATPEKLTQMAQQQQSGGQQDAAMSGAIAPMTGMEGSGVPGGAMKQGSARELGRSWPNTTLERVSNKASAIARFRRESM